MSFAANFNSRSAASSVAMHVLLLRDRTSQMQGATVRHLDAVFSLFSFCALCVIHSSYVT